MRRLLEGQIFYRAKNNGVVAITSDHALAFEQKKSAVDKALLEGKLLPNKAFEAVNSALDTLPTGPVFTFVARERFNKSPWFTEDDGILPALIAHIEAEGGRVIDRNFHVPFSNDYENVHGDPERLRKELRWITSPQQFIDTFHVTTHGLWSSIL